MGQRACSSMATCTPVNWITLEIGRPATRETAFEGRAVAPQQASEMCFSPGSYNPGLLSRTIHHPLLCGIEPRHREMPYLGRHEVRRQLLGDFSQGGIGYESDPLDVLVMASHKAEVGRHCSKALPSRK